MKRLTRIAVITALESFPHFRDDSDYGPTMNEIREVLEKQGYDCEHELAEDILKREDAARKGRFLRRPFPLNKHLRELIDSSLIQSHPRPARSGRVPEWSYFATGLPK